MYPGGSTWGVVYPASPRMQTPWSCDLWCMLEVNPPPVNRMTHGCKKHYLYLSQTSFAGGKKWFSCRLPCTRWWVGTDVKTRVPVCCCTWETPAWKPYLQITPTNEVTSLNRAIVRKSVSCKSTKNFTVKYIGVVRECCMSGVCLVNCTGMLFVGLIQLRNELASYLKQSIQCHVKPEGEEESSNNYRAGGLPEPISNHRQCSKCPHLLNCTLYQRLVM